MEEKALNKPVAENNAGTSQMLENTSKKPTISIILATKGNKLTFLEKCINSIQEQTFRDFEIILIYSVFSNELNSLIEKNGMLSFKDTATTLGAARNLGVKHANGEIVIFIDDDCEAPNDWLSKINSTFQDNPTLSCLGGAHFTPLKECEESPVSFVQGSFVESRMGDNVSFGKYTVGKIPGCNVAYRKAIFEKAGYLNETLRTVEDWEFNIRLVEKGYSLRFDPKIFVWHHRQGLKHSFFGGTKMAPFFPSLTTLRYARYDSFFASFYLSNLLLIILIIALIFSPIVFLILLVLSLVGHFAFTAVRTKTRSWKILYYPLAIVNTLATLTGFYYGLAKYIIHKIHRNKPNANSKTTIT